MDKLKAEIERLRIAASIRAAVGIAAPGLGSFIPHDPTERQDLFLRLPHKEAFYGGAAGGGKSDALLMGALEYVSVPGYAALILRRTFADLKKPKALLDRAREWLSNTGATYNTQDHQWRFPSGATLSFGYLENDGDIYQYQSAEYQYCAFDELTQFSEKQYTFLFSRLRRLEGSNIPLRMRSASNPGGAGAEWVQERFIPDDWTPQMAGEMRVVEKNGRAFVPARLQDNPYLDQLTYHESLSELDDVTRAQLLEGDWSIRSRGNIFPMFEDGVNSRHVITWSEFERVYGQRSIPSHWRRAIGHDWGSTDGHPAVLSLVARSAENSRIPGLYFLYWGRTFKGALVDDVAREIKSETEPYYGAIDIWRMSHEAKSERDTYRVKFGLPFLPMNSNKTAGIAQMRHLLSSRQHPHPFRNGLYGCPRLLLVVDDGEFINPKTDAGLARHRAEFSSYKYADTPVTQIRGQSLPVPYKLFDDSMDSLRGIFCEWGPGITPLTEAEQTELALPPGLRSSRIETMEPSFDRTFAEMMRDFRLERHKRERREQESNWSHDVVDPNDDPWAKDAYKDSDW